MAKKKKGQHGGRRKGAGRRATPDGKSVPFPVGIPERLKKRFDAWWKKHGYKSRSKATEDAIRKIMGE